MVYRSIVVHADLSRHTDHRVAVAGVVAKACGAHLTGAAATGVSALVYPSDQDMVPGRLLDDYFGAMRDQTREALARFERNIAALAIPHEQRLLIDDAASGLVGLSRFADLVVLSQDDPRESLAHADSRLPEYAIMHGCCPVLVVPPVYGSASAVNMPARVLIAWNGSCQAAAAIARSLPFLRCAQDVVIVRFAAEHFPAQGTDENNARRSVGNADDDGELAVLRSFLDRHGIQAQARLRVEPVDMGHAILAFAEQAQFDLIVMGCYGHWRVRELCLGGVSRTLLRCSKVPMLMAHR